MEIRLADWHDLPAIVAIYNASIPGHQATADLNPVSVQEREQWFAGHEPAHHPLWVAVDGTDVIGWLSLSTYYARSAYDPTAELSVYVHPDRQRRGVGRALLEHALGAAPALGIRTVIGVVFGHNHPSLALLESTGFKRWGHLPGVTHMPEGRRDVVLLGLELDATPDAQRSGNRSAAIAEARSKLLRAFEQSRAELMAAIDGLTQVQMIDPVPDGWSMKDHLVHVAHMDELRFFEISRISQGKQAAHLRMTREQVEALNRMTAELRRPMSLQQALWELQFSRARVMEAIHNISAEGLDESRYGEIGLSGGARHEIEHAVTIGRWREAAGL